jgi:hypothetical protein
MDDAAVLYETDFVPRARRVAIALAFGALPPLAGTWWRWVRHGAAVPTALHLGVGVAVALAMIVAAVRSRTVFRVEVTREALRVHRDPGVVETFALAEVTPRAEPTVGGWSRNPAETLCLVARDGSVRIWRLPDDAHTPGIVEDIVRVQGGASLAELTEAPTRLP